MSVSYLIGTDVLPEGQVGCGVALMRQIALWCLMVVWEAYDYVLNVRAFALLGDNIRDDRSV